jgi:hypothetical protein
MIVDDLNVISRAVTPNKADAPLVVDPDAVLALSVSFKGFEPIAGWLP